MISGKRKNPPGKDTELQMLHEQKGGKLGLRQTCPISQFEQRASLMLLLCHPSICALSNFSTIPSKEKLGVCSGFFPK